MSQRSLLVGALALTFALGGALFVYNQVGVDAAAKVDVERCKNNAKYYRQNKNKCKQALAKEKTPTPAPTLTPSVSPSASLSPDASPTATAIPATPSPSPVPSGSPIAMIQIPEAKKNFPKLMQNPPGLEEGILRLDLLQMTKKVNKGAFKNIFDNDVVTSALTVRFDSVWKANRVGAPLYQTQNGPFVGLNGLGVDNSYAISHGFTTGENNITDWQTFTIRYRAKNAKRMQLYYRVAADITKDHQAPDWKSIDLKYSGTWRTLRVEIDEEGRYFQYKINLDGNETRADTVGIIAQPLAAGSVGGGDSLKPTPTPTPAPTPTVSSIPAETGEGTISISTIYLADNNEADGATPSPSPSPSSNALLPTAAPGPSPTPTPKTPPDYTDLCFDDRQIIENAANVALAVVQKTNIGAGKKPIKLEDQRTDEDGVWQGIAEQKKFPVGTYEVTFGEFRREDYKLVAFCDPNTGALIRTQSDLSKRKAAIRVKTDQESELIALYGPRSKPYISLEKYAVPAVVANKAVPAPGAARRLLNQIYPGVKFNYLLKYTNTGEGAAKSLLIRDVIPSQYEVDQSILDAEAGGFQLEPDLRGGTLVTKTVGEVPSGGNGWISIPVTLKADAFTDVNNSNSLLGDF